MKLHLFRSIMFAGVFQDKMFGVHFAPRSLMTKSVHENP